MLPLTTPVFEVGLSLVPPMPVLFGPVPALSPVVVVVLWPPAPVTFAAVVLLLPDGALVSPPQLNARSEKQSRMGSKMVRRIEFSPVLLKLDVLQKVWRECYHNSE